MLEEIKEFGQEVSSIHNTLIVIGFVIIFSVFFLMGPSIENASKAIEATIMWGVFPPWYLWVVAAIIVAIIFAWKLGFFDSKPQYSF